MTAHFIRRSGGINYIRYVEGIPYLYTSGVIPSFTVCQTGTITSDYAITFIDEAHPLYVVGSGQIGGMWGPDVYYYNEHIDPNFPSCAHILFDVDTPFVARGIYQGQSITEDPFYVYPTGVDTNSPVGCELPMPELNVVQIARPSGGLEFDGVSTAIGTISQTTFKDNIISGIETVWGTGFWDRMAAVSGTHKLWIIRESGLSLGSGVIQSGVDLFKNYLTSQSIDYTEHFPSCGDTDRYLGWLTDCITYSGANISCTGLFIPPNIITDIQGSGSHPGTNKLVTLTLEGYSSDGGDSESYYVEIHEALDNTTVWDPNLWSTFQNNYIAEYRDLVSGGFYRTYSVALYLTYENGLHKLTVSAICYTSPQYQTGDSTTYQWKCIVPLDKYGIPNGTVQPDELEFTSVFNTGCIPRFPSIVFTSYPSGQPLPSGTDCTQFNP